MYVHTYMYIHTHIHIHICVYIYVYIYISIYAYICIYVCIYVYIYIHIYVYLYSCTYIYILVYIHLHIHMFIYIYIDILDVYIYIHMYMYKYVNLSTHIHLCTHTHTTRWSRSTCTHVPNSDGKFSKVISAVIVHTKFRSELTFENLLQGDGDRACTRVPEPIYGTGKISQKLARSWNYRRYRLYNRLLRIFDKWWIAPTSAINCEESAFYLIYPVNFGSEFW